MYLNLTNPYELTSLDALAEEIKAFGEGETPAEMGEAYATDLWLRGYDGIEIQNDEEFGGTSYVAFDENQIKRTTNKNPTKDADIRFSVGGIKAKTADVGRLADAERMEQGARTVRRCAGRPAGIAATTASGASRSTTARCTSSITARNRGVPGSWMS